MDVRSLEIPDVKLITPQVFLDERGSFLESYHSERLKKAGIVTTFVQDNQSQSVRGALRGLHYQMPPHAQAKLVRVLQGEIFDVAVDIRAGSPTFGQWVGEHLSGDSFKSLFIPEGFAHGFLVLSEVAIVLYKCSTHYMPNAEAGLLWNDTDLAIDWPLKEVILSPKDRMNPRLKELAQAWRD
ncbi:MAG: dTDP-4-dehydrorhamnose 3,5-epimerase [Candidatus Margulisiibacteriota bacterium]